MKPEQSLSYFIQAAKGGDQNAFRFLLDLYWNDVFSFLQSKISVDHVDAEDIAIVTFSKAFDKLSSYNEDFGFKTWLLTIARNLLIDEFRRQKNLTISIEQENKEISNLYDETPSPEDKIIIEQNLAQLKRNIKRLKPKYQEVINLRYFQEFSYAEIAKELNEPINNVKVKLLRAKKLLSEIIITFQHED